ncbi:oligosaccharide flippase family protein [Acinetobacter sp. ANC 4636]
MQELKLGIILSYLTIIVSNMSGLISTSLIVKSLPTSEYGIYILAGSIVAILSILDSGITASVTRYIAKYRLEKNIEKEGRFLGFILKLLFLILILILISATIFYNLFDEIYKSSFNSQQINLFKNIWFITIASLLVSILSNYFSGCCFGYEKFIVIKVSIIAKLFFKIFIILMFFVNHPNIMNLVIIDFLLNFFVFLVAFYYSVFVLKIRIDFNRLDFSTHYDILKYAFGIFIFLVASNLQWQVGQIICSHYLNSDGSAIFGIGIMLGSFYGAFASAISGVFLARTTNQVTNTDTLNLANAKVGISTFSILFPIFSGFLLYGDIFIKFWAGNSYSQSWIVALGIMVVSTIPLGLGIASQKSEALGLFKYRAYLNLLSATFGVILSIILVRSLGILGVLIGLVLGVAINNLFLINFYIKRVGMNFNLLIEKGLNLFLLTIIVTALNYLGRLFLQEILHFNDLFTILVGLSIFSISYIGIVYVLFYRKNQYLYRIFQ